MQEKLSKLEASIAAAKKKYALALSALGLGQLLTEFQELLREIVTELEKRK